MATAPGNASIRISTHLLFLFLLGLALRVAYLIVASNQVGFDNVWQFARDTTIYFSASDFFLTGDSQGNFHLLKTGPGYPLVLAAMRAMFGTEPILPIALNIVLGSLAPVAVYLLAFYLLDSRAVAIVAGLISSVSHTSIALSSQILTDQSFYTYHATALVCFVLGFRSGKLRWFVLAGVLAGWAAWIRSAGELWPWLFLLIAFTVPVQPAFNSRRQMIRRAAITGLVALAIVSSWSLRNKVVYDLYAFSTNGVLALRGYLLNMAVCEHTPGCKLADQGLAWSIEDGDETLPPPVFYANARARSLAIIKEHPDWVLRTYIRVLGENIRASNIYLDRQIPSLQSVWKLLSEVMSKWLGYLLALLSVTALAMLIAAKRYLAAILLGTTYVYFTLIAGLSFWQGSRLHYPAEIAWAILVACCLVGVGRFLQRFTARLRMTLLNRSDAAERPTHSNLRTNRIRLGLTCCVSLSILFLVGCSSDSSPPGLALPWTAAHASPQTIRELPQHLLTNTNVDLAAAARYNRPLDIDSIEMTVHDGTRYYHPVAMTHRCFHFLGAYQKTKDMAFVRRAEKYLLKLKSTAIYADSAAFVPYPFDYRVHKRKDLELSAPWYSAMAQGELLSISIRLYELTGREDYAEFAGQLFHSFAAVDGLNDPWVARIDTAGFLWLEEYPLEDGPGQTLNGFIAAVYGVYDYWRVTGRTEAKHMYDACLTTLKHYLPEFRRPNSLSYYCLGHRHVTDNSYHLLHISMCRELFRLSGDSTFLQAAIAFEQDSLPRP